MVANKSFSVADKKICLVCKCKGLKLQLNYGVMSCQKCKSFFFRNHKRDVACNKIKCGLKRKCRGCRLEICLKAGMKKEFLRENGLRGGRRPKPGSTLSEVKTLMLLKGQLTNEINQLKENMTTMETFLKNKIDMLKESAELKEACYEFKEALTDYQMLNKMLRNDKQIKEKITKISQINNDINNLKIKIILRQQISKESDKFIFDEVYNLCENLIEKYRYEINVVEAITKEQMKICLENPAAHSDKKCIGIIQNYLNKNVLIDKPWFLMCLSKLNCRNKNHTMARKCYEEAVQLMNRHEYTKINLTKGELNMHIVDCTAVNIKSEVDDDEH